MAKQWSTLRDKMSLAQKAASAKYREELRKEMPLRQLRAARELTQANLAEALEVNQSEVSKIEGRTDMYVSTLASYVKAMGGTLEIRAVFPDGEPVTISQFKALSVAE